MESKLKWEGPFKKEQTLSEYFVASTPLGEIQIRFCNATNLSTEALMPGNPGQNHKVYNVGIIYKNFPNNNKTFSEIDLFTCFNIVDNWFQFKYQELRNIFNPNPELNAAEIIHTVFANRYYNIAKEHKGKTTKDIPDCVKVNEAIEVLEEIFPETKFKG